MRIVYRYWLGNLAAAGLVGGLALLFGVGMWDSDGAEGPVMAWWTLPAAIFFIGLLVVRCLRLGVTVDDVGITKREFWATTFVPWTSVVGIEFPEPSRARLRLDDERLVSVTTVERGNHPSLRDAYVRVRARWTGVGVAGKPYPRPGGRWVTFAFWVSAVAVVFGGLIWDDARFDADVYAARDRRDLPATATIADVHVTERTSDGDTTYTTHVKAWLRTPDEQQVLLKLQRSGDLRGVYGDEDPLPIVYDSAHPRDADFADRPNRDANDESVAVRSVTGPVFYWLGIVVAVASGAVIAVEWLRRRPLTRRTSASLR